MPDMTQMINPDEPRYTPKPAQDIERGEAFEIAGTTYYVQSTTPKSRVHSIVHLMLKNLLHPDTPAVWLEVHADVEMIIDNLNRLDI